MTGSPRRDPGGTLVADNGPEIAPRTATINHIRGILAEYGIVLKVSAQKVEQELNQLLNDAEDTRVSPFLKETLRTMTTELAGLYDKVKEYDRKIEAFAKENPICQRLMTVPGVGILTATVLLAMVEDPFRFKNGRHFAAYIGLVPRQHSSGGKNVLLGISKRGDTYLRTLLIHGGRAVVRSVQNLASSGQELRGGTPGSVISLFVGDITGQRSPSPTRMPA